MDEDGDEGLQSLQSSPSNRLAAQRSLQRESSENSSLFHRDYYETRSGGRVIIFNHEKFEASSIGEIRLGTQYDAKRLAHVFDKICSETEYYLDFKYSAIMDTLKKVSEEDHSELNFLIVIVLTHGRLHNDGQEYISANDKFYPPSSLWLPFRHCSTLNGKPKVFIIEACRGAEINEGMSLESSNVSQPIFNPTVCDGIPIETGEQVLASAYNMPDLLVARSTFIGFKSIRLPDMGTIYIDTLVRLLESEKRRDLVSLLTKVNRQVSEHKVKGEEKINLQMPCFTSSFTKRLCLFR